MPIGEEYRDLSVIDLNVLPYAATNITTTVAPPARSGHCMTALNSTAFMIYGGILETPTTRSYYEDTWIYQSGTGWTDVSPQAGAPPRRVGAACTVVNGQTYMFGGWGNSADGFNDIWMFDPASLKWKLIVQDVETPATGQPSRRYFSKMIGAGKHLIMTGGARTRNAVADDARVYFFDTVNKVWVADPNTIGNIMAPSRDGGYNKPGDTATDTTKSKLNVGAVVGGVLGGVVVIAAGVALFVVGRRRRRANETAEVYRVGAKLDEVTSEPPSTYQRASPTTSANSLPQPLVPLATEGETFAPPPRTMDRLPITRFDGTSEPPPYEELTRTSPSMPASSSTSAPESSTFAAEANDGGARIQGLPHVGKLLYKPGGGGTNMGDEIMVSPGDVVYVR